MKPLRQHCHIDRIRLIYQLKVYSEAFCCCILALGLVGELDHAWFGQRLDLVPELLTALETQLEELQTAISERLCVGRPCNVPWDES
jgi:hypothetical protein